MLIYILQEDHLNKSCIFLQGHML